MPLIDTSAWIEYLRKTGSDTNIEMRNVLTRRHHICDAVTMEILSGARDDANAQSLKKLLSRATVIETKEHGLVHRHSVPNVRMLQEAVR